MRQAAPILRCCLRQPLVLSVSQLPHRSHLQGSGHPPNFLRTKTQVRSVILASFAMAGPLEPQADRVLKFWLGESYASDAPGWVNNEKMGLWFQGGPELDAEVVQKFGGALEASAEGQYNGWTTPYDKLASIIIADQLTKEFTQCRNAYRGTAKMYSLDSKALAMAVEMQASGDVKVLKPIHRFFAIMPFMHSESEADQQRCVDLMEALAVDVAQLESEPLSKMIGMAVGYGKAHLDVVKTWGRFPHRNAILKRPDTPEEKEALANGTVASF